MFFPTQGADGPVRCAITLGSPALWLGASWNPEGKALWLGGAKAARLSLYFSLIFSLAVMAATHSSFWQFQRMVKHITGRSAFFSYYGYGCYCGLGGKGAPVDDTDK